MEKPKSDLFHLKGNFEIMMCGTIISMVLGGKGSDENYGARCFIIKKSKCTGHYFNFKKATSWKMIYKMFMLNKHVQGTKSSNILYIARNMQMGCHLTQIFQGYFIGAKAITSMYLCLESNLDEYVYI